MLRELDLLSLKRESSKELDFSDVSSGRMRGNGYKLENRNSDSIQGKKYLCIKVYYI